MRESGMLCSVPMKSHLLLACVETSAHLLSKYEKGAWDIFVQLPAHEMRQAKKAKRSCSHQVSNLGPFAGHML